MKKYPAIIISVVGIILFIIGLGLQNKYPYLCIIFSLLGVLMFLFGLITRDVNYNVEGGGKAYFKVASKKFLFAIIITIVVMSIMSGLALVGMNR